MKFKMLAAAAASLVAFGAQATTIDWGVHDSLEVAAVLTDPGSFDDTITFSIPGASNIASTTVSNNLMSVLGITGGQVSLYEQTGSSSTLLGSYSFDGTTGNNWHSTMNLASGNYYYEITGTATGSQGGFYSISSSVTPVPEPETYALLLAGLGAVGFVARRRKAS